MNIAVSSAAIAAASPTVSENQQADLELLALGAEFEKSLIDTDRLFALVERGADRDAKCDEAHSQTSSLARQIEAVPATTLAGLQVKARAVFWTHCGEPVDQNFFDEDPTTDLRLAASIIRDLLALRDPIQQVADPSARQQEPRGPSALVDPIFAAIERHKIAWRALDQTCTLTDEVLARREIRKVNPEHRAKHECACEEENAARAAFVGTAPTTESGILAGIGYAAKLDHWLGETRHLKQFAKALRRSPLLSDLAAVLTESDDICRDTSAASINHGYPAVSAAEETSGRDAELLELDVEIRRLDDVAAQICVERFEPFDDKWHELAKTSWKKACAYGHSSGREAAIKDMSGLLKQADRLFERMRIIPAMTQAGRAAKVRALLVHVMGKEWRGPEVDDWAIEQARALLGEFAGLSADELAAI
jgi:hypothetical protein